MTGVDAMASSELAAGRDPGVPPERIDPYWLLLQRLDDIKRDQDRLHAEMDGLRRHVQQDIAGVRQEIHELRREVGDLRREVDQKITRLTGWFITGLVAVLGTVIGLRFLP